MLFTLQLSLRDSAVDIVLPQLWALFLWFTFSSACRCYWMSSVASMLCIQVWSKLPRRCVKRIVSLQANRVSHLRTTQRPGRSITRNKVCRPKIAIDGSSLSPSFHSTEFVLINFNISSTIPFSFSNGRLYFGTRPDVCKHNWQRQSENLHKSSSEWNTYCHHIV